MFTNAKWCDAASLNHQHSHVCLNMYVVSVPEAVISPLTVICFLYKVDSRYIWSR